MSGTFPLSKPDWSNVEVIHKGTLPPRAYFHLHTDESTALQGTSSDCSLDLNGIWKFYHSKSPFSAPQGFESPDYDTSRWDNIQVPGHWQLQGWGAPHYTNVNYIIPVDPPNVPFDDNQTGSYVRIFEVPEKFADQQLRLRFEGVDSAFHVYVNGKEVGYSQGSRNPSEFDISSFVSRTQSNILAVRVYQWSDASYLEDQDQWRFSGIFRDVALLAFPETRIEDFYVQTLLDDDYRDAILKVDVTTHGLGSLALKLIDPRGQIVSTETKEVSASSTSFSIAVANPLKWSAESPALYKLVLSLGGRYIAQKVGFRRVEIVKGIYRVNGKRIVFRGANRHEHHPLHGRAVPYEFMKRDLLIMKQHNINAIRTCHQPSDPRLYGLADELGLWVMDEADLECHGFGTIAEHALTNPRDMPMEDRKIKIQGPGGSWTSDNPVWEAQYVDRANQLVSRDKNHPCVVMWSLGNEAFYGRNFQSMYDHIKSIDKSRPIHYEGDFEAQTVDLFSQMYSSVDSIIQFAGEKDFTKPLVLCEFVHAMGNGPGNIKEYVDAFYKYPRLQGGWVWEWANHGLLSKDLKTGSDYMAYGGDFGDEPNDYNFILDGVLFSNHTPTPGLTEYAKAIEPVQLLGYADGKITLVNRYDTITLDNLVCQAYLVADSHKKNLTPVSIPTGVQPHTEATVDISLVDLSKFTDDVFLQLDFSFKEQNNWSPAGTLVASSQVQLQQARPLARIYEPATVPAVDATAHTLNIATLGSNFTFSLASGRLVSWLKGTTELIHDQMGPNLTLSRAMTDNDRPQDGRDWVQSYLKFARPHMRNIMWSSTKHPGCVDVVVSARLAPVVLSWSFALTTTYRIHNSGKVHIFCTGKPEGQNLPPTIPRIGLEMAVPASFDRVSWFGRGPGECYKDSKLSQHFGNYHSSVDGLFVDYEFPQENGNRTDVRWVKLSPTTASSGTSLPYNANAAMSTATNLVRSMTEAMSSLISPVQSQLQDQTLPPGPFSGNPRETDEKNVAQAQAVVGVSTPSITASFGDQEGFSFNASHYTAADLEQAKHPFDLKPLKRDYIVLRLDADHHGLGTGSCGPKTLDQYALKTGDFEFELLLE